MSIIDERIGKDTKESLELAEESRQKEWLYPSFVSRLFEGKVEWRLIYPFPEQPEEEKAQCDRLLARLEKFLRENLDPEEVDITREIPKNVIEGLFDMGIFAVKIPKEYGGLGMSQVSYSRIVHLISSYCGSTAALVSAHQSIGVPQPIILFGSEEQKKKYLPRFMKGAISGFALTEPEAGSDPKMMKTTATPIEGGRYYLLNGEKLWCTNGNIADILVVMAQTPPKIIDGKEKKQITAFIVETDTPGFEVVHRCRFMGLNGIQNGLIRFNNVKVPRENILLGEGKGLKLAFITLNTGRLTLPAAVTGLSKWCLYVARYWASRRRQWGKLIGEHQMISTKLSKMAITIFAMDALCWLVTHMADNKRFDIRLEAAISKLFCTEENWKIINDAIQIRGGRGYECATSLRARGKEGFALERALRDSRINTILEGSSEIMRLFIAREALDFHLKKIGILLDRKVPVSKRIKTLFQIGIFYFIWYFRLSIGGIAPIRFRIPTILRRHMIFVSKNSRRLAKVVFHKMLIYQQRLIKRQNLISRFVDIGVELFVMSCVCSYGSTMYNKDNSKGKDALRLADLYCRESRKRIKRLFYEINHNNDRFYNSISKDILSERYRWIENDIVV